MTVCDRTVLVALEAISALLFEGITIGLTWVKTVPTIRQIRRDNHRDTLPVTYVIFQDGKCHLFYLTGFCSKFRTARHVAIHVSLTI